jgi:hypothetical protein
MTPTQWTTAASPTVKELNSSAAQSFRVAQHFQRRENNHSKKLTLVIPNSAEGPVETCCWMLPPRTHTQFWERIVLLYHPLSPGIQELAVQTVSTRVGNSRLYDTLCKVLDSLRAEAPPSDARYNPPPGNSEGTIQARSRALLHLFLKARFGLVHFGEREAFVTDGPHDGGIDAYYIDKKNKTIYVLQSKFRASPGNFVATNMSADDLLKMDVARIMQDKKRDEKGALYNERIIKGMQSAIQKLTDAGSYTTQVALLGNTKNFSIGTSRNSFLGTT